MIRRLFWTALLLVAVLAAIVVGLNFRGEDPLPENLAPTTGTPEQIQRGEYLAKAGNCAGCHTAPGGEPYAGGSSIDTPFGRIYTSNLTPDADTGLGRWNSAHFWRAMHNGRSMDGRLLYPAFPYPNYTQVTREDSDAIYAYLRSLAPVRQQNRPHEIGFPYNTQAALGVWRALFFKPGSDTQDGTQSAQWNRGAYLVQGLGHCSACHSARNALGGNSDVFDLGGGLIPMQNWYAPSLTSAAEAGVAHWSTEDVVALLRDGVSPQATVLGPMSEVVFRSTQYLSPDDLNAMAVYLKSLPQTGLTERVASASPPPTATDTPGAKLYQAHCVACHGTEGQGVPGAYPALAGNRAVTMDMTANLVRVLMLGGYAPATKGNPRPYGMPPFATVLSPNEAAAVLTYIRGSWGNQAAPVSTMEVNRYRTASGH